MLRTLALLILQEINPADLTLPAVLLIPTSLTLVSYPRDRLFALKTVTNLLVNFNVLATIMGFGEMLHPMLVKSS